MSGEGYAVLYLDRIDGVVATQERANEAAKAVGFEFEPTPRDELHITLVYAGNIDEGTLRAIGNDIKGTGLARLGLGSDMLEWFGDDIERKALVHRVFDDKLSQLQRDVFKLFEELDTDGAMQLSEFSTPDDWNAHVTIGYSREFDMTSEDIEFDAVRFAVARGDYQNIVEVDSQVALPNDVTEGLRQLRRHMVDLAEDGGEFIMRLQPTNNKQLYAALTEVDIQQGLTLMSGKLQLTGHEREGDDLIVRFRIEDGETDD